MFVITGNCYKEYLLRALLCILLIVGCGGNLAKSAYKSMLPNTETLNMFTK